MPTIDQRAHRVFDRIVQGGCSWERWQQLDSLSEWTALDSMAVLEFLAGLEAEFGIRIPAEDLELSLFTDRPRLLRYLADATGAPAC